MLTQKKLKERLEYNPKTGFFTILKIIGNTNKLKVGDEPGWINKYTGYKSIIISGKKYKQHRLAWFYVYGEWPKDQIDHINRIKDDNRIQNLREATPLQNMQNKSKYKNNMSGTTGVCWDKKSNKWRAAIQEDGCRSHLGFFKNKKDAIKARRKAEIENGYLCQ